MTILDIILAIPLLWAIYKGFKDGIVVQLGGLAGLLLGVFFAFKFCTPVGRLLSSDPATADVIGFVIVVVVAVIAVALLSRLLRRLLNLSGLGMLDNVGGAILGVLKMGLILGLLLYGFDAINKNTGMVRQEKMDRSIIYRTLSGLTRATFPYLNMVKDKLLIHSDDNSNNIRNA